VARDRTVRKKEKRASYRKQAKRIKRGDVFATKRSQMRGGDYCVWEIWGKENPEPPTGGRAVIFGSREFIQKGGAW